MSTEKPPPLRGYREIQETQKQTEDVDAKRFKEEMSKVSESDEAQKRQQRNLKKSEEESDDEPSAKGPIAASGDLFSLFMSDTESSSMLKPQTPQNIRSTEAPTSSSSFNIEDDGAPSAAPTAPTEAPSIPSSGMAAPAPSFTSNTQNFSTQRDSSGSQDSPSDSSSYQESSFIFAPEEPETTKSTTEQPQEAAPGFTTTSTTESPTRSTKKTTQDTSLLAKKAPSAAQALKQKKDVSPAEIKLKPAALKPTETPKAPVTTAKKPTAPPQQPIPKAPISTPHAAPPAPQQAAAIAKTQPAGAQPQIHLDKETKPPRLPNQGQSLQEVNKQATKTHTDSSRDHSSKDKDERKDSEMNAPAQVTPIIPFTPAPVVETPAYATLPPQVYELFEKMVGLMTIEQHNGVTTTTVTVNMKNSVFDGAQIILDHYSTAPNSFNVTIAGSQQAQELVSANLASMVAAFEQSKLAFQINLRSPILLEEERPGKRKKPAGDDKDQDKRQRG